MLLMVRRPLMSHFQTSETIHTIQQRKIQLIQSGHGGSLHIRQGVPECVIDNGAVTLTR